MYFNERKRFPKELFLPGFPTRDNLQTGTEDSQPHLTIPNPGRPGGVLIIQLFFYVLPRPPLAVPVFQIDRAL